MRTTIFLLISAALLLAGCATANGSPEPIPVYIVGPVVVVTPTPPGLVTLTPTETPTWTPGITSTIPATQTMTPSLTITATPSIIPPTSSATAKGSPTALPSLPVPTLAYQARVYDLPAPGWWGWSCDQWGVAARAYKAPAPGSGDPFVEPPNTVVHLTRLEQQADGTYAVTLELDQFVGTNRERIGIGGVLFEFDGPPPATSGELIVQLRADTGFSLSNNITFDTFADCNRQVTLVVFADWTDVPTPAPWPTPAPLPTATHTPAATAGPPYPGETGQDMINRFWRAFWAGENPDGSPRVDVWNVHIAGNGIGDFLACRSACIYMGPRFEDMPLWPTYTQAERDVLTGGLP